MSIVSSKNKRGVENITEGLSGLTLVSFFKVYMKNFHPI